MLQVKEKEFVFQHDGEEWVEAWYRYYRMKAISEYEEQSNGDMRLYEVSSFLDIMTEINKDEVTLLELGAGWGEWCLALAGVVNFGIVPTKVRKFNYLAVEGEPYYCELIAKHFEFNMLPIHVLNCAVSDQNGWCTYDKFIGSRNKFDTWCTQGMTFRGNIAGSKLKTLAMAGYRLLHKETTQVLMMTIDTICMPSGKSPIYPDIIHMDIEGIEAKAIKACKYVRPLYWMIGTHHRKLNDEIMELLAPQYYCIENRYPAKDKINGIGQDGLQVFKLKEH